MQWRFNISSQYQLDIIGDIHAHAEQLQALLTKLGYEKKANGYSHSERKALFIGDYINRGPENLETVDIIRKMVDNGDARALMGNHEYNAIAYHKTHPETGKTLRPHHARNIARHKTFLDEMAREPERAQDALDWFMTLPLAINIDHGYFVHACWDHGLIDKSRNLLGPELCMTEEFVVNSVDKQAIEFEIIETVLKGPEIDFADYGVERLDNEGKPWNVVRVAWWPTECRDITDVVVNVENMPDTPPIDMSNETFADAYIPPDSVCFFGHYWMTGEPQILADNIACVDYSIAKQGSLVCYRWNGETDLSNNKFMYVE
ncbi:MAG: metallophosphoesterase [Methyloligellaceae bacterium]